MNRPDWDQYFMTMAYLAASRSTDESTHAGTVIVRPDNSVLTTGYNGPVRGMTPEDVPTTRPEKYFYQEHSERNAIYSAASHQGGVEGCRLYVNFLPCADCARAIVQAGITEVIVHKEGQDAFHEASGTTGGEWDASHQATMKIFEKEITIKAGPAPDPDEQMGMPYVAGDFTYTSSLLRWWSGELWMPTGFFRAKEFKL